jgi:hypothetical protein
MLHTVIFKSKENKQRFYAARWDPKVQSEYAEINAAESQERGSIMHVVILTTRVSMQRSMLQIAKS